MGRFPLYAASGEDFLVERERERSGQAVLGSGRHPAQAPAVGEVVEPEAPSLGPACTADRPRPGGWPCSSASRGPRSAARSGPCAELGREARLGNAPDEHAGATGTHHGGFGLTPPLTRICAVPRNPTFEFGAVAKVRPARVNVVIVEFRLSRDRGVIVMIASGRPSSLQSSVSARMVALGYGTPFTVMVVVSISSSGMNGGEIVVVAQDKDVEPRPGKSR